MLNQTLKIISLLLVTTFAFAQPKSIHYSAFGNYLVDQDGNKTTIDGHPQMVCYRPNGCVNGKFLKAEGSTIWLIVFRWNGNPVDNWDVMIQKPVCDLK